MSISWHRSRLFWLGFLGVIFLLWIWFGFHKRSIDLCLGTRNAEYCFGWGGWGQIAFTVNRRENYTGLDGSPELGFYAERYSLTPEDDPELFGPAVYLEVDRPGIFFANWLVVLVYTTIWLAGVAHSHRRKLHFGNIHLHQNSASTCQGDQGEQAQRDGIKGQAN